MSSYPPFVPRPPLFYLACVSILVFAGLANASFCTSGPHAIDLAKGVRQQFPCSGTCYACLVHFETTVDPLLNHQYRINILSNDEYIYKQSDFTDEPWEGPEQNGPALFGDGSGSNTLELEIECDANNPHGSCNGMTLEFGFVNCGCPEGEFIVNRCSGFNDATCSTERPEPSGTICFSGETLVYAQAEGKAETGPMKMKDLRVTDRVLTNNLAEPYQPVYMFAHIHPELEATYLQIYMAPKLNGKKETMDHVSPNVTHHSLEISPEHMVYVYGKSGPRTVRAASIQVGDILMQSSSGADGIPLEVTKIASVMRQGVFAPLTPDGTIIVTEHQIVASTYVDVFNFSRLPYLRKEDLLHTWLSPLRMACLLGGNWLTEPLCQNNHNQEGMQHWIAIGLNWLKWFDLCTTTKTDLYLYLFNMALLLSLVVTGPFRALEIALGPSYWDSRASWLLLHVCVAAMVAGITKVVSSPQKKNAERCGPAESMTHGETKN